MMGRIVTVAYGVLSSALSVLIGGVAADLWGDPMLALIGAIGGVLSFFFFLNWAWHPIVYVCPTCHPEQGFAGTVSGGVCSRCALQ